MKDTLLLPGEVAERLRLGEAGVRKLIREGQLPAVRLGRGRGYRVREADLEAFLAGRTYRPRPPCP